KPTRPTQAEPSTTSARTPGGIRAAAADTGIRQCRKTASSQRWSIRWGRGSPGAAGQGPAGSAVVLLVVLLHGTFALRGTDGSGRGLLLDGVGGLVTGGLLAAGGRLLLRGLLAAGPGVVAS